MWNSKAFIILLLATFSVENALASCDDIIATQTYGVEWEIAAAEVNTYELLWKSHFRKLYSFYGMNDRGEPVQNLIPRSLSSKSDFEEFKNNNKGFFREENGQVFLAPWEKLSMDDFANAVDTLMNLRGRFRREFYIRKNAEAWKEGAHPFDVLIPEVLSEEWRTFQGVDHFVGFEFSMNGHVTNGDMISDYLSHLWSRLGFELKNRSSRLKKAAAQTDGHVHWVPKILVSSERARLEFYSAVIGYWGDRNDAAIISHLVPHETSSRLSATYHFEMDIEYANFIYETMMEHFQQYSIQTLTRETYLRLKPTADGIQIAHRSLDLNTEVDANFPPVFKRLIMGLRGLYGPTVPKGQPVEKIGLEGRSYESAQANLDALPMSLQNGEVDMPALFEHNSPGDRGIVSRPSDLERLAKAIGMEPAIVKDLLLLKMWKYYAMARPKIVAELLLPLNNWLGHPLAKKNLQAMNRVQHEQILERYRSAQARYVRRMNKLAESRRIARVKYQPEWKDELPEFVDGINRVYPRNDFPEIAKKFGERLSQPDHWFVTVVAAELVRFVTESGLQDLIK